jgi:hypothetical protein
MCDLLAPEEGAIEQAARRAARPAWHNAHADRVNRELDARRTSREYRKAQREAEIAAAGTKHCNGCDRTLPLTAFGTHKRQGHQSRCKPCQSAACRANYHRKLGRTGTGTPRGSVSPEQRRKASERIAHLTSLLLGTNPNERIDTQEGWDVTTAELQKLWLQAGDKECAACKQTVPPSAMRPPGLANFYPGHCRSCAKVAYEASHRATFGPLVGPLEGPPKMLMRDGSRITVAELARRHRERERF